MMIFRSETRLLASMVYQQGVWLILKLCIFWKLPKESSVYTWSMVRIYSQLLVSNLCTVTYKLVLVQYFFLQYYTDIVLTSTVQYCYFMKNHPHTGEEMTLSVPHKRSSSTDVSPQPSVQNGFHQEVHDVSHDTGSGRSSPSMSPSHNQQSSIDSPGEISRYICTRLISNRIYWNAEVK